MWVHMWVQKMQKNIIILTQLLLVASCAQKKKLNYNTDYIKQRTLSARALTKESNSFNLAENNSQQNGNVLMITESDKHTQKDLKDYYKEVYSEVTKADPIVLITSGIYLRKMLR